MPELCTCDRARTIIGKETFDWGTEKIPLPEARGRILAEPLIADRDQPPFHRVAMDGIAINHAAYAGGRRDFARARVQGAGQAAAPLTDLTQCVEIMTGAALPKGCTAVIRYEDLVTTDDGFLVPEGVVDGQNIHARGKDTSAGAMLATVGHRVDVATLGMLATFGYARIEVQKLPNIAVVATGDELVEVGDTPAPHQIRRSNLYQLQALLASNNYPSSTYHLPDDREVLQSRLGALLQEYDVIILSGGVSKGKYDYLPGVLEVLGAKKLVHGVAQRPGKPLWVGRTDTTMVFGLPGNPQSSLSCCLTYVLPFLAAQSGADDATFFAELATDVDFKPDLTLFAYVRVDSDPGTGRLVAKPIRHAGSGDASSLLRGNAFMELPSGRSRYPAGGVYQIRYL